MAIAQHDDSAQAARDSAFDDDPIELAELQGENTRLRCVTFAVHGCSYQASLRAPVCLQLVAVTSGCAAILAW